MSHSIFNPNHFNQAAIKAVKMFSAELLTMGFSYIVKSARPCKTRYGPKIVLRLVLPMWETIEILTKREEEATMQSSSSVGKDVSTSSKASAASAAVAIQQEIIVDTSDEDDNQQIVNKIKPAEPEVIDVFLPSRYTQFFNEANIKDFNSRQFEAIFTRSVTEHINVQLVEVIS